MDELESKIVQLTNRITQLELQLNSGIFSNTILQSKNLIQASGAMTSPNFVSGSAGWSLNSEGDLEANDGTFRGNIYASGGQIGGFTIDATSLTAVTGGIITGGTIQTDTSGLRIKLDGDDNSLKFMNGNTVGAKIVPFLLGSDLNATFTSTNQNAQISVGESSDNGVIHISATQDASPYGATEIFLNYSTIYMFGPKVDIQNDLDVGGSVDADELHAGDGESRTVAVLGADGVTACFFTFTDGILTGYTES